MLRKVVYRAECEVEIDWFLEGSVLRGTVKAGAKACRTSLHIDSPEPQEVIEQIVRLAKQGCFAEQMIQAPVPLTSTYVLNGIERQIEYLGSSWVFAPYRRISHVFAHMCHFFSRHGRFPMPGVATDPARKGDGRAGAGFTAGRAAARHEAVLSTRPLCRIGLQNGA